MADFLRNSDAFIWSIERDPRLRSTIVSLLLLDRPPDWGQVVDRFDRLSQTIPMFRQRVVPALGPAPPRWKFDPDFDLAFHVRRVTAPQPGTMEILLEMARIATMADFDRARPLWEVTLVDGLSDRGAALLCKLNHALTDGVGAIEIAKAMFDPAKRTRTPMPEPSQPAMAEPTGVVRDLMSYEAAIVRSALARPLRALPALAADGVRRPRSTVSAACSTLASIYRTVRPTRAPGSSMMLGRSQNRRLAVHQVPEKTLREAGRAGGATLNDAFIAAVAGGLNRYHETHGIAVDDFIVTMPISIRTPHDPAGGNRATLMRFHVPAGITDPKHRIRIIHELTSQARSEKSLAHTQLIAGVLNCTPRWYVGSTLRHVDFIASDVPGLPTPVSFGGAAVKMQYAFSPTLGAAVNVTLLSYVDICGIGINVDTSAVPDVDILLEHVIAGFDEVLALAKKL